jgi:hypothetical protein
VAALVADESAVQPGYHLPELVVRDAVRTTSYGHSHGDIHPARLFRAIVPPPIHSHHQALHFLRDCDHGGHADADAAVHVVDERFLEEATAPESGLRFAFRTL